MPPLEGCGTFPGFLEWYGGVGLAFVLLASLTVSEALCHSKMHSWPPVPFPQSLHKLVPSQVPEGLVHVPHDLGSCRNWGYVYPRIDSGDGAHQDLEFVLMGPVEGLKLTGSLFIQLVGR